MAVDDSVVRERLTAVFARQDFYEACRQRDAGAMVRILNNGDVTQGRIAIMTGISQVQLSGYARGKHHARFASIFEQFSKTRW